jgi:Ca2+-dependent lipid-binding protein
VGLEIVFLNNAQGKFIISSIEAELLRDTELVGNMDPYVLIQLDDQKTTTKAKESQGKQCTWSEKIELKVCQGGNSMLKFRIFDRDPVRDDLVG